MISRKISPEQVKEIIQTGEIIRTYPNDKPYPSILIYKTVNKQPIHIVVAKNETTGTCIVVTVYEAGEEFWEPDFKTKRK